MKIDVLTLFPKLFEGFLTESIIGRAIKEKKVEINIHNFRDYSTDPHKKVDDTSYGGGCGMVLMIEPIYNCLQKIKTEDSHIILMTPQGKTLTESISKNFTAYSHLIIICGHYEGFDERIRSLVDEEISIGDYILTGGELASMVLIDSTVRLIEGVIDSKSLESESFDNNLLDYPVYTKPADFNGMKVPDILLSGDHAKIDAWRKEESIKRTKIRRNDLLEGEMHEKL